MDAVFSEHVGQKVRLGRKAPSTPPKLKFASYVSVLAAPPLPRYARNLLGVSDLPMYGNDRYGDCTCAAVGHCVEVFTWRDGKSPLVVPPNQDVLDMYWQTGDGQDTGRYCTDVLGFWRRLGLGGKHQITAYAGIDVSNHDHIKAAIYLFGCVYIGIALPISAQSQAIRWSVVGDPVVDPNAVPGSWGGHCIPLQAYNQSGASFVGVTWGKRINIDSAFLSAYMDEAYAVISPEWLADGASPQGFDMAALQADLAAVTG